MEEYYLYRVLPRSGSGMVQISEEAPPGFEPGMDDLQSAVSNSQTTATQEVTETPPKTLAYSLACETQKSPKLDPDLAALVGAWPTLPDAIRAGIMAMIRAAGG
jgi:hypothetical protein